MRTIIGKIMIPALLLAFSTPASATVRYFEVTIGTFYSFYTNFQDYGTLTIDFSGEDLNNDGVLTQFGSSQELLSFSAHFTGDGAFPAFDLDGLSNLYGLIYAYGPQFGVTYNGIQQGLLTYDPTGDGFRIDGGTASGAPCSGTYNACFGVVRYADGRQVQFGQSNSVGQVTELFPSPTPEPASWAMMIGGFGLIGAVMRRRGRARFA